MADTTQVVPLNPKLPQSMHRMTQSYQYSREDVEGGRRRKSSIAARIIPAILLLMIALTVGVLFYKKVWCEWRAARRFQGKGVTLAED